MTAAPDRPALPGVATVAVSGAGGFVGGHLCERLTRDAVTVRRCAVHGAGPTAAWPSSAAERAAVLRQLAGCDAVVHLAGRAHVVGERGMGLLEVYRAVNRDTTLALARAAVEAGVPRFVFVSTVRVHGDRSARPFQVDDAPAPTEPYAISKHEAEQGLHALARATGLEVVVVRPPLVYGPGVKANFLRLLKLVSLGLPLPLGAIRSRRSLVSVWNLADLLVRCVQAPAAVGQTFFAGDGEDIALDRLLVTLAQGMGRRARLLRIPPALVAALAALGGQRDAFEKLGAPFQVDLTSTLRALDWRPPVPLDDGLRRTARWYAETVAHAR